MDELSLFGEAGGSREDPAKRGPGQAPTPESGGSSTAATGQPGAAPLAARMRPRTLVEFVGQRSVLGEGSPLKAMLEGGALSSLILWGPPGSGKTTLARLLAERSDAAFVAFSAVTQGVARVREIIAEARERLRATGRRTILFCDEIHRFNKAQQDAFLPHVEEGVVVLVGATTENPSFEIVRPLLSRAPVFVLEPLEPADLIRILERALTDPERGVRPGPGAAQASVLEWIARYSDGDARRALGVLERANELASGGASAADGASAGDAASAADGASAGDGASITLEHAVEAAQHRFPVYDKSGEEHYNVVSALHKAVRGSDPDGALYWLARMLNGGEDPLYIARRLVRIASEDIGLADPEALPLAIAGRDAYHFLGSPEGELALAEVAAYLATAPKSNHLYTAWREATDAARETPGSPVPLHIRNAPTDLMKDLGYGEGYEYDPDAVGGVADQTYLPEGLEGRRFYRPGTAGHEASITERLQRFAQGRKEGSADRDSHDGNVSGREAK